jgi:hypothetical protein
MQNPFWKKTLITMGLLSSAATLSTPKDIAPDGSKLSPMPESMATIEHDGYSYINKYTLMDHLVKENDALAKKSGLNPDSGIFASHVQSRDLAPHLSIGVTHKGEKFIRLEAGDTPLKAEFFQNDESDADIDGYVKRGSLIPLAEIAEKTPEGKEFLKECAKMADRMGIHPKFYINNSKPNRANALADTTKEGHLYIEVDKGTWEKLSYEDSLEVIGHEFGHLKRRDYKPEAAAKANENPAIAREHEFGADAVGAGPLGTKNPKGMAHALQKIADLTPRLHGTWQEILNPDHPPVEQRIERLEQQAALQSAKKPPDRQR